MAANDRTDSAGLDRLRYAHDKKPGERAIRAGRFAEGRRPPGQTRRRRPGELITPRLVVSGQSPKSACSEERCIRRAVDQRGASALKAPCNRSRVEGDNRIGGRRAKKMPPKCVVNQTRRAPPDAQAQGRPRNRYWAPLR